MIRLKGVVNTILVGAGCALLTTSCTTVPQGGDEGFVSLFDGKSLDGWTLLGQKGGGYVVEDGAIVCTQGGGGNLFHERQFADFVLRLEFKLKPGSNNGIAIRAPKDVGSMAYKGMEIQTLDHFHERYGDRLKPFQYHGSVYGVIPAATGALKPVGEWNEQEIRCEGRQITVRLNGAVILDANLNDVIDHETLLAHPGMLREAGHVGFLGHNDWVAYRNIRVKELPKARIDNLAPEGFKALFNGRDLTGWRGVPGSPPEVARMSITEWAEKQVAADAVAATNWVVLDGAITHIGKEFHNLATEMDYGNVELVADWKLYDGGDSGIYLRGSPQVNLWTVPEGSGGLYNNKQNLNTALKRADRFPGSWNRLRIVMLGDKVTVQLNDELVVWDPKKRTGVTFENYWERDKPIYDWGPIELQAHQHPVHFKNIYVRQIP